MATKTAPQSVEDFAAEMDALADSFGADLTGVLDECRQPMLDGIANNFDNGSSSSGEAWPAHSPVTVAMYGPHPLLILSGKMKAAATGQGAGHVARIEKQQMELGVSKDVIPYAGVHQFGFPEKNIPRREYLGVSDNVGERIEAIIADGVMATLE